VKLLKFPEVFKAWIVALNQKEDIVVSKDEIEKVSPFLLRVREQNYIKTD